MDDDRLLLKIKAERKLREKLKRVKYEKNEAIKNLSEIVKSAYQQRDAATSALSTLQAENEKLRAELEQVKRERYCATGWSNALRLRWRPTVERLENDPHTRDAQERKRLGAAHCGAGRHAGKDRAENRRGNKGRNQDQQQGRAADLQNGDQERAADAVKGENSDGKKGQAE